MSLPFIRASACKIEVVASVRLSWEANFVRNSLRGVLPRKMNGSSGPRGSR